MGKWLYRREKNKKERGLCIKCNKRLQACNGNGSWKPLCKACNKKRFGLRTYTSKKKDLRKDFCQACGFKATHKCQLDLDHIDGNHSNNDPTNLQTLCANCHRLKTYLNKDWEQK